MSPLRVRRESLADDSLVVVRGGPLDRDELLADAERAFRRFGEHAVSVLVAPTDEELDAAADLNAEDETGLVWTFLDEAPDPTVIRPGEIVVAGSELTPAVCEVVGTRPSRAAGSSSATTR